MNVHEDGLGCHVCEMLGTRTNMEKAKALVAYTLESIEEERSRQALIGNLNAQLRSISAQDQSGPAAPSVTARVMRRGRGGTGGPAAPTDNAVSSREKFCEMDVEIPRTAMKQKEGQDFIVIYVISAGQ